MASRFLPLFAAISLLFGPSGVALAEPGLALEPVSSNSASPFRPGDILELIFSNEPCLRITVLETGHWPWVRARCDHAPQSYETWINFALVRSAKRPTGE